MDQKMLDETKEIYGNEKGGGDYLSFDAMLNPCSSIFEFHND